jgi:hypothetical protein
MKNHVLLRKKIRVPFSPQEETLLVQSWLNISKDALVGTDQKVEGFWLRIKDNYNAHCDKFPKREAVQLKSKWHRLNVVIQKFAGCYKQANRQKKSGASEKDVMVDARTLIYFSSYLCIFHYFLFYIFHYI